MCIIIRRAAVVSRFGDGPINFQSIQPPFVRSSSDDQDYAEGAPGSPPHKTDHLESSKSFSQYLSTRIQSQAATAPPHPQDLPGLYDDTLAMIVVRI